MDVLDFGRSFVTMVTPIKEGQYYSRLQVEAVTTITDTRTNHSEDYFSFASCKAEEAFAKEQLFFKDNYDFCGILSSKEYAIFRTYSTYRDIFYDYGLWTKYFNDILFHIKKNDAKELSLIEEIVDASIDNLALVGRVEFDFDFYNVLIQFPVKTMNMDKERVRFQVDTGPIAFPDLTLKKDLLVETMSPAFVAYNAFDFADFIIQAPHACSNEGECLKVTHFSKQVSLQTKNSVLTIK